jgi:hypothetical protein
MFGARVCPGQPGAPGSPGRLECRAGCGTQHGLLHAAVSLEGRFGRAACVCASWPCCWRRLQGRGGAAGLGDVGHLSNPTRQSESLMRNTARQGLARCRLSLTYGHIACLNWQPHHPQIMKVEFRLGDAS